MKMAIVNGETLTQFMEDAAAFEDCVGICFESLDVDGDGLLSRAELREGFGRVLPLGGVSSEAPKEVADKLFDKIFERFDLDRNGAIDRREFKSLSKEVMLAMARGLGITPVQFALHRDSLLMRAVKHESARDQALFSAPEIH